MNESKQYAYAAFATFTRDFGKLTLNLGLRWESIKFDYLLCIEFTSVDYMPPLSL